MFKLFPISIKHFRILIFYGFLFILVIGISSPLKIYGGQSSIDFYTPNSPPGGAVSIEPLMAKWWNFRVNQSAAVSDNWPECLKGDGGTIGNNQSIIFLGDPASANVNTEGNVNATNQKCKISSDQLLFLVVYAGECSTGIKPHEGEYPDKNPSDLLSCAVDSNKEMKLMQVKVDSEDVSSSIIRQNTSQPFKFIVPKHNFLGLPESSIGENNIAMAEIYYLFFKPLPVGDHTITAEVIRDQFGGEPEHDKAKWNISVIS